MGKSSTLLAQIFSLLIRQLAETLDNIHEVVNCPTPPYVLPALTTDPTDLYDYVWAELEEVWMWLFNSMDMLESQLQFGASVNRKRKVILCVCVCVCVCIYVYSCMCMCVHVHVYLCIYIYMYMYMCLHVCVCECSKS